MRVFAVLKKDLKILMRDRGQLLTLFLMPLAFIIPISIAVGSNGYNLDSDFKRPLPVVNYDMEQGAPAVHGQEMLDALAESFRLETGLQMERAAELGVMDKCSGVGPACDEAIAVALLTQSQRNAAVIIPAGFSAGIDAGAPVTLTVLYDPVGDAVERQLYQGVIQGAAMALSIQNQVFTGFDQFEDMLVLAPDAVQEGVLSTVDEEQAQPEEEQQAALRVVSMQPANYRLEQKPDTYQQTVPGYTVMYVFFLISYVSSSIRMERASGAMRRQLYTPASRTSLLGGKLAAAMCVGLMQVAIMFAVGHFAFGMGLGSDPLALSLLTIVLVAAAVSIGLFASTFRSDSAIVAPLIILALLGGCMFPVSWLPPFIRTIGYVIPHTYAMTAYQDLLVRGQGLAAILPELAVLFGFAAIFFGVAVRRFEFE